MWRTQAHVPERTLYSISELSSSIELGVNNADITTLKCALLERMYYCKVKGEFVAPPAVSTAAYTTRLSTFTNQLIRLLGSAAPVSPETIVQMYKGRKRAIYEHAKLKYELVGLTRKDGWLNTFVKLEKVNPTKAPRCIQPRRPVYNLRLARFIKPVEHRIYSKIAKLFGDGPTVLKGYNVEGIGRIIRGKFNSFRNPVAIGLDATKFDMHVSLAALKWEHSIYHSMYRSRELRELLSSQLHNVGRAWCKDGHLKYSVEGRRASGDMNTALGNCLIMCGLVYAYAKEKRIHIKLANNGDDCVVFMEREFQVRFMTGLDDWFLEMGFRMVAEPPVYTLPEIEFCQMHPIEFDDGTCRMVRNIPTALRKDSLSTLNISSEQAMQGWMTAVGNGGLALTGGVPIMQNFYRCLLRNGKGVVNKMSEELNRHSGMHLMSFDMDKVFVEPSPRVRLQVWQAWGITPDVQVELENYFDNYLVDAGVSVVDSHTNYNTIFHALSR